MLWIPGPTEVRPEILAECARPMIGHRSAECAELVGSVDPGLRLAFGLAPGSDAHVAVHTTSASGIMEAALLGAGPRILCCVNGAFSDRWRKIALSLGRDVTVLEHEWGSAIDAGRLAEALAPGAPGAPFDAVTVVSNETSTGARTPLGAIASAMASTPDTLLLVDLVSYIAGAPVDFDANRIDLGLAGVQKAFALPPGITVMCASTRYLERARDVAQRGSYLDPVQIVEGHEKRKTPSTPAIGLYRALARQLADITNGVTLPAAERELSGTDAWNARFAKHERMRDTTLAWADGHGLVPFPEKDALSPTVSCIRAGSLDVGALVKGLAARGLEISNGYGALKGETFRIGHMGDHTEEGLAELLRAADEVLG